MEREQRTLFLVFLTLVVYGTSILLQEGQFILPFPLFEVLFFFVSIQFVYWNRSQKVPAILVAAAGTLQLIAVPTIWTFFLDSTQMMALDESIFFDVTKLLFYLLLVVAASATALKQRRPAHWILPGLFLICLFIAIGFYQWMLPLAYAPMVLSTRIKPTFPPFDYLWLLLLLLEGSYWSILLLSA